MESNNSQQYPETYTEYNNRLTKVELDTAKNTNDIIDLKNITQQLATNVKENEKHIDIVDKSLSIKFTRLETMIDENNKNNNQQFSSISTKFDKMDQKFDTIMQNNLKNDSHTTENKVNSDWVQKLVMLIVAGIISGAIMIFFR